MIDNLLIILSIIVSFTFCYYLIHELLKIPSGTKKMIEIAELIESCAKVYLKRQYATILIVSIFISIFIYIFFDIFHVLGFLIGASLSLVSGYIGMLVSVKSNVKTLNAVKTHSISKGLAVAFRSAGITGLLVMTLSLLAVFIFFKGLIYLNLEQKLIFNSLLALALGASLISIFARLGGGIFTKAADIGADLVGKLELGIDEDDPRNPATIADNVGDNVGDCAGMAADLYETCCVTNIACMLLLSILLNTVEADIIMFPLILTMIAIFSTILSLIFIKLINNNIMHSLYRAFFITVISSIFFIFLYIYFKLGWNDIITLITYKITGKKVFICSLIGLTLTTLLIFITEYYTSTSYYPVRSIAEISDKGHAPNIIQGLSVSMESPTLPVFFIICSMLAAYSYLGVIGIAIAGSSMVSLSGIIITLDAYGPITDNAGGIAAMSKLNEDVRKKTDMLDAVGNTTKAVTKGYAIGSAGLGSLVLFITYYEELKYYFAQSIFNFSLDNPFVITGLLFGGTIPYLFSALSIRAVGSVASKVVVEIKSQFTTDIKIDENFKPNYTKVVDLITKEAIKKMVLPSILPVILIIALFSVINICYSQTDAFVALGSMLLGIIITGIFLAISMTSGGGAWDNAKKYIEEGNFGGKNSPAHKAAVTGDMVGDPYKDTAGPAINPLIKVSNIIAIFIIIFMHKYFV